MEYWNNGFFQNQNAFHHSIVPPFHYSIVWSTMLARLIKTPLTELQTEAFRLRKLHFATNSLSPSPVLLLTMMAIFLFKKIVLRQSASREPIAISIAAIARENSSNR
jgi:hypothetical protein